MRISRNTNQDKKIFPKYMQEKLAITVLVVTLALFALVMVLYDLTKNKQEDYNQIVLANQDYDSRTIPFRRGDILDRNGTYLATSEKVYNLIIDPNQIMSKPEYYLEASVTALVDCFGYDRDEITTLIQEKKSKYYIKYAKQLNYDQKANFETYKTDINAKYAKDKSNLKINGIWFEDEYKRVYPYSNLACNVIGFARGDGVEGTGGIEQFYNSQLMGNNGREYGYLNDDSNLERVIKPARNGNTTVSTIDVNIQKIVEKYIAEWNAEVGSKGIGVLVMDPNNGEVLAMSSDKQFDLNNPQDLGTAYTDETILALGKKEAVDDYKRKNKEQPPITEDQVFEHYSNDEVMGLGKLVAWNQTWRNFCVSDTYEPGSPSKIFTVAEAMEEGVISGSESYECHGSLEIGGHKIRCVNRNGGHGALTIQESLMKSCNVVMMHIAQQAGKERFYKYQDIFGFGAKTGIDLPGEADASTLVYRVENAGSADLATNSFGQNYNCTMVQMAAAYCSVINGGSYYTPHVVKQILNEQGSVVETVEPELVRETVSDATSKYINEALWRTVNDKGGTGSAGRVEGYDVAGKTGTAEKSPRGHRNYVVSFMGYAPAYDPEVLIYVVIDEPNVEDQAHSTFATQVFQKIMAEVLPYLNVFPNGEVPDVSADTQNQLPQQEGISDNTATEETTAAQEGTGEIPVEETTAGPEEEFVEPPPEGEDLSGIPDMVPGQAEGPTTTEDEAPPPEPTGEIVPAPDQPG